MQARCLEFVQFVERNLEFNKLLVRFQVSHAIQTLHEVVGLMLTQYEVCLALKQTFLLSMITEMQRGLPLQFRKIREVLRFLHAHILHGGLHVFFFKRIQIFVGVGSRCNLLFFFKRIHIVVGVESSCNLLFFFKRIQIFVGFGSSCNLLIARCLFKICHFCAKETPKINRCLALRQHNH